MEVRNIQVSDSVEGIARVGVLFLRQISNGPVASRLRERMDSLGEELRRSLAGRTMSEIDAVTLPRKLYHSLGLDPTKDRPSSERLLRRVLRGKALAKINKLVDAINLVSLRLQCPIGVYDWDAIVPPVLVRIGQPGEGYRGISVDPPSSDPGSENWVSVQGKLVVVDGEGPFGSPGHDSSRTKVTLGTVRALVVAWAPVEAPKSYLENVLREVTEVTDEFCSARVGGSAVL
ncbi:MAG TPA: phenylalanine--tRNA ligase beta subunit-related protein [Planctomycetota bacterium]|nr:phenylalanine--tRNA ligase beta subunit-related protein [Planctomycetota bacterium]